MNSFEGEISEYVSIIKAVLDKLKSFSEFTVSERSNYEVILLKYYILQCDHLESIEMLVANHRIAQLAPIIRCMLEIFSQMYFLSEDNEKIKEKVECYNKYKRLEYLIAQDCLKNFSKIGLQEFEAFLDKERKKKDLKNPNHFYRDWFKALDSSLSLNELIKRAFENTPGVINRENIIKNHYKNLSKLAHAGPFGLNEIIPDNPSTLDVNQNEKYYCYYVYFSIILILLTLELTEKELALNLNYTKCEFDYFVEKLKYFEKVLNFV